MANDVPETDVVRDALYYPLFDEAERVRWRMADVPFHAIERDNVSSDELQLLRGVAASELTTYTASRKFLQDFADDVDFTQWISVWFYEESRHPHVWMRYLSHFGERFDSKFVRRGRMTSPFMKSRLGTLVTNVISEMVAASEYARLAASAKEPVMAHIARNLAGDEARHASGFYSYARKYIRAETDRDEARGIALKVLYLWLRDSAHVGHPVNQFHEQRADRTGETFALRSRPVRVRVCQMIGTLVDARISDADDVMAALKSLARDTTVG